MPAEVISLLSSPSSGPSPIQPAPPQSRLAHCAAVVSATATALPYNDDDDVFDLTADSHELRVDPGKDRNPPRNVSGTKRPREEGSSAGAPVFMSDDFDTTIDLDSSLPIDNGLDGELRDPKRPCHSPPRIGGSRSFERSRSATDYISRPPVKLSRDSRRAQTLDDPIEFSSSPGFSSKPVAPKTAETGQLAPDDPFASSQPTSAHSVRKKQKSPEAASKPIATMMSRVDTDMDSDDPFASSPRPPQPAKPSSKPCTIVLDDDDDDDDPFASSPKTIPTEISKPQPPSTTSTSIEKGKQRAESPVRRSNWDPISSSAPELHLPSDPFDTSPPRPQRTFTKSVSEVIDLSDTEPAFANVDVASDDDFPDLDSFNATRMKARISTKKTSADTARRACPKPTKHTSSKITINKSAHDRAKDKEAKNAERERVKERKKQEREAAKEQKAKDKERAAALAEVNKVRTDKKVSTPEMIADLPASLPPAVTLQIQTLLKDLDVEHSTLDSPVANVVKWRRKVASRFNEELGHWEPIPMRVEPEKYALVIVPASDFVTYALGPQGSDLEAHVLELKRHFPQEQLIYLIEGLNLWMRKNRNVRNRQFVSAVRNQGAEPSDEASGVGAQPRRRKNQQQQPRQQYIDEDSVEDALLQLQVMHDVLIHHTNVAVETAHWVAIFTQHISTVPYRKQREAANAAGAGFCMETGQVRTGEDVQDTYVRMLQELGRVTAPIAVGIASEFETATKLVRGLEARGPLALENCRKSTNRDGGFSDRTVGKAVSKRVYKVFTGRDEWSTDV